jgi:hypothetical protein
LTDRKVDPAKFKIPDNTIVPAKGYVTFDARQFDVGTTAFNFNAHGEEAWLVASALGCNEGYCHGCKFGELENGFSVGRYTTSDGRELFVKQNSLTLGSANSGPLVGPLIISEIMYHSIDDAADFVEITNISEAEVPLSHPQDPEYTWKLNGAGFTFPKNTTIKPGESVVIASDSLSIEAFKARYQVAEGVRVFQMTGGLKNGSEKLELQKPEDPYIDTTITPPDTVKPYEDFDVVNYSDKSPWPTGADGMSLSLHRKSKTVFGNDPANWISAVPTPGKMD